MKFDLQSKIEEQQVDLLRILSWTIEQLQDARDEIKSGNKQRGVNDVMTINYMSLIKYANTLQITLDLQEQLLNSDWLGDNNG
jgi:hypothetical protein